MTDFNNIGDQINLGQGAVQDSLWAMTATIS